LREDGVELPIGELRSEHDRGEGKYLELWNLLVTREKQLAIAPNHLIAIRRRTDDGVNLTGAEHCHARAPSPTALNFMSLSKSRLASLAS